MKHVANGSTDVTTYFVLRDSTNHAPKTDVTVSDLDLYYQEQGAAQAAKADATALAAADSAHADNKAYHCGNGIYRVDWPDAAFDGGVGKEVVLIVVCSGCDTVYERILLSPPANTVSIEGTGATDQIRDAIVDDGVRIDASALNTLSGHDPGEAIMGATDLGTGSGLTSLAAATALQTVDDNVDAILAHAAVDGVVVAAGSKAGYALTAAYDPAKTAAKAGDAMTLTAGERSSVAAAVWAAGTRTLSSFGTLAADVWAAASRTLTDFGFTPTPSNAADTTAIRAKTDNLPADPADASDVSSAIAALPTDADVQAAAAAALTAYDPPTRAEATADKAEIIAALPEGGDAPTAAAVADAVWDEALAGHAAAGSAGAALTGAGVAGDPWTAALPGAYGEGTAGAILPALEGAMSALGAAEVTVTSPVAASGAVTIYAGDDYAAAHGRSLAFDVADAAHALGLDAPAAVVRFKCRQATWTATSVASTGAGYTVTFEPSAAQTAVVTVRQTYELEAVLADGDVVTLATGALLAVRDIPVVP